jgi:hypothetical protein
MDELYPVTFHVIWGCGIVMTIFNYITTNVALAHVMSLKKGMEF